MFISPSELDHLVLFVMLLKDLVSGPHSGRFCSPCLSGDLGWAASHHALCIWLPEYRRIFAHWKLADSPNWPRKAVKCKWRFILKLTGLDKRKYFLRGKQRMINYSPSLPLPFHLLQSQICWINSRPWGAFRRKTCLVIWSQFYFIFFPLTLKGIIQIYRV